MFAEAFAVIAGPLVVVAVLAIAILVAGVYIRFWRFRPPKFEEESERRRQEDQS